MTVPMCADTGNLLLREGLGDLVGVREEAREIARIKAHARGRYEGRVKGREVARREVLGEAVLDILAARGLEVSETTRSAILACTARVSGIF
jgi:hypothetical protein